MAHLDTSNDFNSSPDALGCVDINMKVRETWLDVLAKVATLEKLKGMNTFMDICEDHGFMDPKGNLVMSTKVGGQMVQMEIPQSCWAPNERSEQI